jgi:hypothetical protein
MPQMKNRLLFDSPDGTQANSSQFAVLAQQSNQI